MALAGVALVLLGNDQKRSPNPARTHIHDLSYFYPKTASGTLAPTSVERVYWSEGESGRKIGFIGDKDGSMVPIEAHRIHPTEENIFTPGKIESLVEGTLERPLLVYPGYGDILLERGHLEGHLRDGNHRSIAAIEIGAPIVWIMMSDVTKQYLDQAGMGHVSGSHQKQLKKLYEAIRKAQKAHGAPLFRWKTPSKVRGSSADVESLLEAERAMVQVDQELQEAYQTRLQRIGFLESPEIPHERQLRDPQLYIRLRIQELKTQQGIDWVRAHVMRTPESNAISDLVSRRGAISDRLYDLRERAGLDPRKEHLDPSTGKVVRSF